MQCLQRTRRSKTENNSIAIKAIQNPNNKARRFTLRLALLANAPKKISVTVFGTKTRTLRDSRQKFFPPSCVT
jgi:hypothetical protein